MKPYHGGGGGGGGVRYSCIYRAGGVSGIPQKHELRNDTSTIVSARKTSQRTLDPGATPHTAEQVRLLRAESEQVKHQNSELKMKTQVELESLQEQLRVRKEKQYQLLEKLQGQEEAKRQAEDQVLCSTPLGRLGRKIGALVFSEVQHRTVVYVGRPRVLFGRYSNARVVRLPRDRESTTDDFCVRLQEALPAPRKCYPYGGLVTAG